MLISLVVPCFNEAEVVRRFHAHVSREIASFTPTFSERLTFEFVYVDDGSGDETLRHLRCLAGEDSRVRYVSFSRNFGKEAAMLAGLRHAGGDAVVIMDADLQHPPELIARMITLHTQGNDQVVARRTRAGDRVTRTLTARAYYRFVNRLVDVELVDGVGDFRLLSRRAVDAVLKLTEYNRFSKGIFAWIGYPTETFAYENAVREQGRSKWTFGKLLNYGLDGVISFNNKPLRAALYLGLLLLAVAMAYTAWIVGVAVVNGVETPGYVTLLVAVTALSGVQMVLLGVVGEYVGRIYYEAKRRPHFLVGETDADVPRHDPETNSRPSPGHGVPAAASPLVHDSLVEPVARTTPAA